MITIKTSESTPLTFVFEPFRPLIYLDQSAIQTLSADPAQSSEFLRKLQDHGTLYVSGANAIEVYSMGPGPKYDRIRNFLRLVGRNWALMDSDYESVIQREKQFTAGEMNPCFDQRLMEAVILNWKGTTDVTIDLLFD